jgi:DNA mismatch endonuclease, patch repair protein
MEGKVFLKLVRNSHANAKIVILMDNLHSTVRTKLMRGIRAKNTTPELKVRSFLHMIGFRFRTNVSSLPGSPDVVLPRYHTAIFIHGCFWHGHKQCKRAALPKTRTAFWEEKIHTNQSRDRRVARRLRGLGWNVWTIWQCEVNEPSHLMRRLSPLLKLREGTPDAA